MNNLTQDIARVEDTDAQIANDLLEMSKLEAILTTTHCMECVTPEIRQILTQALEGCLDAHAQLTDIAVSNGWYSAYEPIATQLQDDLTWVKRLSSS